MKPKIDFKKSLKQLYNPPAGKFCEVVVPVMQFVKVDGEGNPNTAAAYRIALEWLYGISYAMKFAAKKKLQQDYVVPPLEGLWWADDPESFVARNKDAWKWTIMIMVPDFVSRILYEDALVKTSKKAGAAPTTLRLEALEEGLSLQTMHIGSYDDEGPTLSLLHDKIMPERGFVFNGPHHEIYLGDPRKTQPAKLKTVLRQPVKSMI